MESSTADMLTISEVDANSIATINGIKLLSDKTSETLVQIANVDIHAQTDPNPYIYTTNIRYKIVVDEEQTEGTWLKIVADGYGGLANAVYVGATDYSVTEEIDDTQEWIFGNNTLRML